MITDLIDFHGQHFNVIECLLCGNMIKILGKFEDRFKKRQAKEYQYDLFPVYFIQIRTVKQRKFLG